MIQTFKISFRLKTAYRANSFLYNLKQIPVVKKALPDKLYANRTLKRAACVFAVLTEVISLFLGKALYVLLFLTGALNLIPGAGSADGLVQAFLFLALIGCLMNNPVFEASQDKYYSIFLMQMDAKECVLSHYGYFLAKYVVGFWPALLWAGHSFGVPVLTCLLLPAAAACAKTVFGAFVLWDAARDIRRGTSVKTGKKALGLLIAAAVILLAAAYGLLYLGWLLPRAALTAGMIVCLAAAVPSLIYLSRYPYYRRVCRELLDENRMRMSSEELQKSVMKESYAKGLDTSRKAVSRKTGYAYFNDLFVQRHRRILTKSAKRTSFACGVVLAALLAACLTVPELKGALNRQMLTALPWFLFIMYLLNRGKTVTQAMFMNCDHSMLTYRFYRQPDAILGLFKERLKSVVAINLMPAAVIALGLPLLLFATGGTENPLEYVVLLVSILSMSVFFSVHNLVLYYLLQPYNVEIQMKSSLYSLADIVTYAACYWLMGMRLPTFAFGVCVTVFCAVYIAGALALVYRLAPATFKLRK